MEERLEGGFNGDLDQMSTSPGHLETRERLFVENRKHLKPEPQPSFSEQESFRDLLMSHTSADGTAARKY